MSGVPNPQVRSLQDGQPLAQQHGSMPMGPASVTTSAYQNMGYFPSYPESTMVNIPKGHKGKKKSAAGYDHVKHRRTRSGCYTCRSRRVKCDETHPICDRCRKGKRECVYPEPPASKQSSTQGSRDGANSTQQPTPESSHEDEAEDDSSGPVRKTPLEPIADNDEPEESASEPPTSYGQLKRSNGTSSSSNLQRTATEGRQQSETPSFESSKNSSPSASTGTSNSLTPATLGLSELGYGSIKTPPEWAHLPPDIRFYLGHYYETVTHYHYSLPTDKHDFYRQILPGLAVENESLLYALVGFSAYLHTLRNPNGKMEDFLHYYNKSVTLLLVSLQKNKDSYTIGNLLTVLQLATIEEYLGDWVNLFGHQKAACEMLLQLFTPETIMQSPATRMVLVWYSRFDICVGLMGGFGSSLPEEWFSVVVDYYSDRLRQDPDHILFKYEKLAAHLRLISRHMSDLLGKASKGLLSGEAYVVEHQRISRDLQDWRATFDPELLDPAHQVQDFSYRQPIDPDDVVDPYAPGVLYEGVYFHTTILLCDWHSCNIMHTLSTPLGPSDEVAAGLRADAYAICQIFEAIEFWPDSPTGCLITIQACLAIAYLFLPQDDRHRMWMRHKFALLESMGYIFAVKTRLKMADLFKDESCVQWWLPDDQGFTPILKSIREFADERNAKAVSVQAESIREVNHIFSKMDLGADDAGRNH